VSYIKLANAVADSSKPVTYRRLSGHRVK